MKKLKSFIITLLVFIAVTALADFLLKTGLLELFLIGLILGWIFLVVWYIINEKFFNN
jgi:hypothetical protein